MLSLTTKLGEFRLLQGCLHIISGGGYRRERGGEREGGRRDRGKERGEGVGGRREEEGIEGEWEEERKGR